MLFNRRSRWLNLIFKTFIVLLLVAVLWYELNSRDHLASIWQEFKSRLSSENPFWLLAAILLMPFNWLAETRKWYQFVRRYEPDMSRWRAVRAVLSGVSFSLFTPNRVGEYGGRILYIRPEHHWKAIIANVVCNISQIVVLIAAGLPGALWFMLRHWHVEPLFVQAFALMTAITLVILFVVYFNIGLLVPLARRIPLLHRIKHFVKDIRVLEQFSRRELTDVLRWSAIRYLIYATQYFCLLHFFGIETGVLGGFSGIAAIFLLQTSIPLPPVTGLMARGGLAIQVWSVFHANEISALAATFSLWIINLILPALVGTFSLFYVNISKNLGYDD